MAEVKRISRRVNIRSNSDTLRDGRNDSRALANEFFDPGASANEFNDPRAPVNGRIDFTVVPTVPTVHGALENGRL